MARQQLTRRGFLKAAARTAMATPVVGAGGWLYAHQVEPGWVEVEHVTLKLPRLAEAFHGYRLAQLSDLHIDAATTRARLEKVVALVNRQQPDAVALTGDFVTFQPEKFAPDLVAALQGLAPRDATVAVLGNHDHWTKPGVVRAVLRDSGIHEIGNRVHTLERGRAKLHLAGVDDPLVGKARLERVLPQLAAAGTAILLAHEPDFADAAAATGRFDLQLSGHSHGGQVVFPFRPPLVLPPLGRKYFSGLYKVGSMLQYTNRGIGMVWPRYRFNCRPEVTLFTLETL